MFLICLLALFGLAAGCVAPRYTSEIVFPPTVHDPGELLVVWPMSVKTADVYTTTSGGMTFSGTALHQNQGAQ